MNNHKKNIRDDNGGSFKVAVHLNSSDSSRRKLRSVIVKWDLKTIADKLICEPVQFKALRAIGTRLPWSAAHLGEDNSGNKPTGRRDSSALIGCPPRRG